MRILLALISTTICLLSACQRAETPPPSLTKEDGVDSAAIYQEWAYREIFANTLGKAEEYAYRSVMLSKDSVMENSSMILLCYIYYREGKQDQLQMLMQTISPESYANVMDIQWQVEQAKTNPAICHRHHTTAADFRHSLLLVYPPDAGTGSHVSATNRPGAPGIA